MGNLKNPTALLMQRMAAAGKGAGSKRITEKLQKLAEQKKDEL